MGHYTVPTVIEKTPNGERVVDVYSRLLSDRIIYLGTEIDDDVANVVVAQLLHLESDNPDAEIGLYINSPGGSMSAMTAIYDTMQFVRVPVATTCIGQAASAAAILLAAGAPGRRALLPHTRVLLLQPSTGGEGQISDLALQARELLRVREEMELVLARHTGQDVATLRRDTDRDKVFTAEQAVAYGLADMIVSSRQPALARPA
ncbi:MAG TPA: ATP-dependent Clp protease proteolytic subunit [Nakamurella sp.]